MSIGPLEKVNTAIPSLSPLTPLRDEQVTDRQIVTAVQDLNRSEWMSEDRELRYRRDPKTGLMAVQIVARDTGEIIDQIPPEVLLQIRAALEQEIPGQGGQE